MAIEKVELKDALNALVTNTNIDKVTGVLGGVPSNIAKADLASVVAGLMGYDNTKTFTARTPLSAGTDFNDVKQPGSYRFSDVPTEKHAPFKYGVLLVFATTVSTLQICTSSNGKYMYQRIYWTESSAWTEWVQLDNFGYNTLAELSKGMGLFTENFELEAGSSKTITFGSYGSMMMLMNGINPKMGMYMLPWTGTEIIPIIQAGAQDTYFRIEVASRYNLTVTNISEQKILFAVKFVNV